MDASRMLSVQNLGLQGYFPPSSTPHLCDSLRLMMGGRGVMVLALSAELSAFMRISGTAM